MTISFLQINHFQISGKCPAKIFALFLITIFWLVSGCSTTREQVKLPQTPVPEQPVAKPGQRQEKPDRAVMEAKIAAVPGTAYRNIPYRVEGVTYFPIKSTKGFTQEGTASWYGPNFHGKLTSNKEVYDMDAMTAAHKTLPFDTWVKVKNLENEFEVVVRINDRGPFIEGRIIDLSRAAAVKLNMIQQGTAKVRLTAMDEMNKNNPKQAGLLRPETFSVQVAVFSDSGNAANLVRKFENGRIQPFMQEDRELYRILVGRHSDFEEALRLKDWIQRQGFNKAFIVVNH